MKKESVVICIFNEKNEVLLLKRSLKDFWMPGKWGLPGGKIDHGEEPIVAMHRELKEESNLEVSDVLLYNSFVHGNWHVFYYFSRKYSGELKVSDEHTGACWQHIDKLEEIDIIPIALTKVREVFAYVQQNL